MSHKLNHVPIYLFGNLQITGPNNNVPFRVRKLVNNLQELGFNLSISGLRTKWIKVQLSFSSGWGYPLKQ
jgi:hypothetical protein